MVLHLRHGGEYKLSLVAQHCPKPNCRPITSYGALDLPTYFIDLTPFVPVLTDGKSHNISIDVVSAEANHTINSNWYVSGSLQVVTDSSSEPTTGKITVYNAQPYAQTSTTGSLGANGDLNVTVSATRSIQIESEFTSGSGVYTYVSWSQNLEYSNTQYYLNNYMINVSLSAKPRGGRILLTGCVLPLECRTDCHGLVLVDAQRGCVAHRRLLLPSEYQYDVSGS